MSHRHSSFRRTSANNVYMTNIAHVATTLWPLKNSLKEVNDFQFMHSYPAREIWSWSKGPLTHFAPPSFISTTTMASPSSSPSPSRPMRSMRRTTLTLSHRSNSFQQDRGFRRDDLDSPAFEGSMILASAIAMNKERHLEYFPMPLHITSDAPLGIKSLDDDKNTWRTTEDEKDSNPHWRT